MNRRAYLVAAGSAVLFAGTISKTRRRSRDTSPAPAEETRRTPPLQKEKIQYHASTFSELQDALNSASEGDIVFVPSDEEINLDGEWSLEVPAHVTLASGGQFDGDNGALLNSPEGDEAPERGMRKIELGTGARLTGFEVQGHHHEYVNPEEEYGGDFYAHRGSGVWAGEDAIVDNNEISGWVFAGVWAADNAHIHRNFLYRNMWEGLGYGVVVPEGDHMPIIEYNEFNYNRHAISGWGGPGVGYIARHNHIGPDWVGAQFDMHGDGGMDGIAGDEIIIRNNTFEGTHTIEERTRNPNAQVPAIHIRGTPETGVWVEENQFAHESREEAYQQTDGPHEAHFSDNRYGIEEE